MSRRARGGCLAHLFGPSVGGYPVVVPERVRFESPEGFIDINEEHWPVVIATWEGSNNVAAVRDFFAWNESVITRARRAGGYLMITDADKAQRPPPDVRRAVAELTDAMPRDAINLSIGNYVVITNPLVRGALTAMQWVSRREWKSTQVGSMAEAIEQALSDLDAVGRERPPGLNPRNYVRP